MRLVCETVVKDVLPAVRSVMAREMQERGYNQTEIAETLDLTQPAVSQYLSASRGKKVQKIEQDDESYAKVQGLLDLVLEGAPEEEVSQEFCEVCLSIRENGLFDKGFEGSEDMDSMCGLGSN